MTAVSSKGGVRTLSRMNFSGYVGRLTIFSCMLTTACCLVVGLWVGYRVRFSVWLVMHTCLHLFSLSCRCYSPMESLHGSLIYTGVCSL